MAVQQSKLRQLQTDGASTGDLIRYNGTNWAAATVASMGFILDGGNTTGAGVVVGTNDNNTFSLETNNVVRLGISSGASTGGVVTITNVNTNTNTIQDSLVVISNSNNVPDIGYGGGILLQGKSSSTNSQDMVRLQGVWTTALHGSRTSALAVQLVNSGTSFEFFRFTPSALTINVDYALGNSANIISLTSTNAGNGITLSNTNATSSILLTNTTANRTTNNPAVILQTTSFTNTGTNVVAAGVQGGFAPTAAGSSAYRALNITPTINQTGGHNGETYDIDINPTLTALGGFHYCLYIQPNNVNAYGIYQIGGNTQNYLAGATGIGVTTPGAKLEVKGTTAASGAATLRATDSAGVSMLDVANDGQVAVGKDYILTANAVYSVLKSGTGTINLNNNSGANITSIVNGLKMYTAPAGANAFTNFRGADIQVLNENPSSSTNVTGLYVNTNLNTTTARASSIIGTQILAATNAATGGTVSELTALRVRARVQNASVTATVAYGLYIEDIGNTGTIGSTYGLYIGDVSTGTQTNAPYSLYSQDTNGLTYIAGKVGIGVDPPTAKLHIGAGATSSGQAQFKLTSGPILTTPEAGAMEFNSTTANLYFTPASNRYYMGMWGYVAKTAAYTITDDDYTIDITANSNTYALPTAVGRQGRVYMIMNSGSGSPVVDPAGSETIAGASSYTMAASKGIIIQSTGAN